MVNFYEILLFYGRDKSGTNISGLSLIIPFAEFKSYLPYVELVEERVKFLIAKLRVLQARYQHSAFNMCMTLLF